MGLIVATKAFFKLAFNRELSQSFEQLLADGHMPKIGVEQTEKPERQQPTPPARSDAISLLAALQRDARFLDIVNEPLEQYSDEQVGAAARDVLKNCDSVIKRIFATQPLTDTPDGSELTTPTPFDPSRFRLTGNVAGDAPFTGTVAHHGWEATQCEVPQWSGSSESAMIVAPIELEVK